MNNNDGANMKDDSKRDDDFCQRLIGPLKDDVAPPNRDLMAAAITAAAEVFTAGEDTEDSNESTPEIQTKESRTMFGFIRPLAAIVATAAAVFILVTLSKGASANVNLGDVLDRLETSKSLQLLIKQAEGESEILVAGNSVRWQDSDRRYRIARGSRLWEVDESENTVADSKNPWTFGENESIDLLALLGSKSSKSLRAVESSQQVQHAGKLCNVFLFQPDPKTSDLSVRCYADAKTNELYTIACWKPGIDPATQPPLTELRLVKRNIDFDEELFVVGKSLSKDGRIGQIARTAGLVQIRPQAYSRWTPVSGPVVLKPGDWIRTDSHGANAATVQLTSGHRVIPGPGSLIEVTNPHSVVLHRGEANFSSGNATEEPLEVTAGGKASVSVDPGQMRHFAVDDDRKLVRRDNQPKWLAGFLGSSNDESLGSLITKIDGRDVPLTVGYHKVKVEIRDQIARTTIEESFVNHTASRLEGQFHFPLPQDASISGFGMWINGELIEADVVEKQRAREIYETILRERRDPGLLEWAGGNIFKARVFPIEPHSEKRIKIVYTQVLPMRANKYRYSYALRSEMLQKNPLRELSLDVQVSSALPLKSVTCPTHSVRTDITQNAASVEFAAQEFTPKRDFEIVCEVAQKDSDVVVVPHQRGDDGYFLAQITPPSPEGNWQRDILPDGEPVNLLMICDTSGSMDRKTRKTQQEFVASILASLGEKDRFDIASCDVDTQWFSGESIAADEESTDKISQWLSDRASLGWTDLDRMADVLTKQLSGQPDGQRTHVIYIGDGIATARDANSQACAGRLRRALADIESATFHCVSIGSSFESGILQALASVGGGSVRQIDGEQTSQRTALELLNEMMQPGLTDLKIEFRGIDVAAVYPQRLPNLAAGTQQIITGRYLPTGENQSGEIVITGKRNGQPVRFASRINMKHAESGNSFIPRLWARGHLDYLLEQGSSQLIQDDVIALSEEFHIMTPYTSLLVLESDEDRERFGVKRRFQMRDGEQFFADGRSKASFELLQKQMKAASNWRLELRRQAIKQLATLGRVRIANYGYGYSPILSKTTSIARPAKVYFQHSSGVSGGFRTLEINGRQKGKFGFGLESDESSLSESNASFYDSTLHALPDFKNEGFSRSWSSELGDTRRENLAIDEQTETYFVGDLPETGAMFNLSGSNRRSQLLAGEKALSLSLFSEDFRGRQRQDYYRSGGFGGNGGYYQQSTAWIDQLAPSLTGPSSRSKPAKLAWGDEVNRLVESLLQPIELNGGQGLEISSTQKSFNARWDRQTSASMTMELIDGKRWLSAPVDVENQNIINWCDAEHRSIATRAWKIGRRRTAVSADVSEYQPGQRPWMVKSLAQSFTGWTAEVNENPERDESLPTVVLTLTAPKIQGDQTAVFTIDRKRGVVLEYERTQNDKQISRSTYTDYVKAAGSWWPQTIQDFDEQNRVTRRVSQSVKVLAQQAFADRYDALEPDEDVYQLIDFPTPTVSEARAKDAGATADFDDYLVLILDACRIQNWTMAFEWFEKLKATAPGKPCVKAIERQLLVVARRNSEALESCRAELERLVGNPVAGNEELFIAQHLHSMSTQFTDDNERLKLLEIAKPIYLRHEDQITSLQYWQRQQVSCLQSLNRTEEAITLQQQMAEAAPWQYSLHTSLAQNLASAGEHQAGIVWLEKQIKLGDKWQTYELDQLYSTASNILREASQSKERVELLSRWMKIESNNSYAYAQYLSGLIDSDRLEDANETAKAWLKTSMRPEKLPSWELTRLTAAIRFATGNRDRHYMQWMEPEWYEPLLEVAEFFFKHEHHYDIPNQFLVNSRYVNTNQAKRGRQLAAEMLKNSTAEMKPAKISSLINLLSPFQDLSKDEWLGIASKLRQRWQDESDDSDHRTIGHTLAGIYSSHASPEDYVSFLQARIKATVKREGNAHQLQQLNDGLFAVLLKQNWNEQVEDAAFDLLTQDSFLDDPAVILSKRIGRLQQLSDAMKNGVFAIADDQLHSQGHPEKLSRQELAQQKSKFKQQSIQHVVDRLAAEHEKMRRLHVDSIYPGLHEEFTKWIKLEQLHFTVLAADKTAGNLYEEDGDFGMVIKACRKMMGQQPVATPDEESKESKGDRKNDYLVRARQLRQQRSCTIFSNLALRKSAPDALPEEVLVYIKRGMKLPESDANHWANRYRMMLLALDRPEELEQDLRKSLRESNSPVELQMMLARLLAEQGKIEDAIGLAEIAKKSSTLSPSDLSVLAEWYLAADRRDDYRRARIDAFVFMQEYQISDWLNQKLQPWQRSDGRLPSELEEDVLFAFQALFEKSQSPSNYCYQLERYYTACRDFRLLQMIPDAVVGRTPQQAYPFLSQLDSQVLDELRNEATMDKIVQRIAELRKTKTITTDLRALDLLEAMVKRRGAEVLNQPEPHVEAALVAMKRAFERDWASGEKLQMGKFLVDLKGISNSKLAAEQLREIRELHAQAIAGTAAHFRMSWYHAQVLDWNNQKDAAARVMLVALREYHEDNDPGLPIELNDPFAGYIELLKSQRYYAAAESILLAELDQVRNNAQEIWLKQQLNQCRYSAYSTGHSISLGEGAELYRNLLDSFLEEAELLNENYCYSVLEHIASMFRFKAGRDQVKFKANLEKYAFEQFPELVKRIDSNYSTAIDRLSDVVRKELGTSEGVRFLVERLENYPTRYHGTYQSGWSRFNYRLADWRREMKDADPLQQRVLNLALENLREGLVVQSNFNSSMLHKGNSYFWAEKEADFARVADEVATEHKDSAMVVVRAAKYIFNDLHRYDQGIQLMLDAKERELLSEQQEISLAYMLRDRKRWKDVVKLIKPWVAKRPANISYRCLLIKALSLSKQKAQRNELLAETEAYLRENNLWNEINLAMLSKCVYESKMYKVAVRLYDELIPMYQRARPNQSAEGTTIRGYYALVGGDNRLSTYYQNLARSHAHLGDTIAAVDAAAGGIVSRGPDQHHRTLATLALHSVILSSKDRDGLITHLDQQAEQTGQDSAIIRKALGSTLLEVKEYEKAIPQLQLAVELEPTDSETHQKLIEALVKSGRKDEATQQMIAQLDFDRHSLEVYKQLAKRLQDNDAMAERAATSLIESAPLEASHHQALAELRQEQDRWDDAIAHWRQVAELRKLEPTGLVNLATAQVHQEDWDAAEATIKKLNQQGWPSRFNNLERQIRKLQNKLPK